ncbi:MAG: tRNA (adenosine(37)-N6)-dimethylallyltransferase MiaA [Candidatus Staskawiczbacteria bacterium]|nr:tRNA (adenosine(37)-N6)-dimethylallyltransferase MiaA [Candidatus Staskawiczbacteria bacterium]
MHEKLIVILGPTASGKSDLAVKLAKKFNGEIVSADSRQVYRGLNIGSGKITKKEMQGVQHHLLNVANPKKRFSVARFQKLAQKIIKDIHKRSCVPFLVGGTGFYIQSVVDGINIPKVKANPELRKKLSKKSVSQLFSILKKIDPNRAEKIDKNNPHRLIRAIEIVMTTKKPVPVLKSKKTFSTLEIGINRPQSILKKLIRTRLIKRLNQGMITEVRKLHRLGVSYKRLEELGLEYKYIAQYLQEKITYQEMVANLQKSIEQFAKRQMTWFKRNKQIHWIKNKKSAENLIKEFIS